MYKTPDKSDFDKLKGIRQQYERLRESLVIPKQRIFDGTSSERWRNHGYNFYNQVFSPRQHLAFNLLIDGIKRIPEDFRESFVTAFSNSLEYNNMMTPYNYPHRKLHHLFTYHALPLTTTPVENAVWGCEEKGAGTFVNCFGRYVKAKEYCQNPYDKYKDSLGNIQTVYSEGEYIEGQFVKTFETLRNTKRGALLFCRDSSRIPEIPDNSVDLVITDPPYFDNIHYSELSNFFYVWLRLLVNNPHFGAESVPTEGEAIVNPGMNKDEDHYRLLLTSVFKECQRVLKEEGVFAFTFHHTKWRAWWMILCAVRDSGFSISKTLPIRSEYKVSPHIRKKNSLDMDLVLFCRQRKDSLKLVVNPDKLTKIALDSIGYEIEDIAYDESFLRFLGELLMISTTSQTDYNWFIDALEQFMNKME
jgi:adenine-specific DNA methylase